MARKVRKKSTSKASARKHVVHLLSLYTGFSQSSIKNSTKLQDDLEMTHTELMLLTRALRSFIQIHKPTANIYLPEVKKSGLTVGELTALVQKRAGI